MHHLEGPTQEVSCAHIVWKHVRNVPGPSERGDQRSVLSFAHGIADNLLSYVRYVEGLLEPGQDHLDKGIVRHGWCVRTGSV